METTIKFEEYINSFNIGDIINYDGEDYTILYHTQYEFGVIPTWEDLKDKEDIEANTSIIPYDELYKQYLNDL